jgi:hypothetical protein
MYLVTWTIKKSKDEYKDYWVTAESLKDAKLTYESLLKMDGLYVASISKVIESTDY